MKRIGRPPGSGVRPLAERFWAKVRRGAACWEWQGAMLPNGYGKIFGTEHKIIGAHRASWIVTHGNIPEGMLVCHHCDNPRCVRPEHLFLGTDKDNTRDMFQKGRGVGVVAERWKRKFNRCA